MLDISRRTAFDDDQNAFRDQVRKFFDKHLTPNLERWEEEGVVDRAFWLACGEAGLRHRLRARGAPHPVKQEVLHHLDEGRDVYQSFVLVTFANKGEGKLAAIFILVFANIKKMNIITYKQYGM